MSFSAFLPAQRRAGFVDRRVYLLLTSSGVGAAGFAPDGGWPFYKSYVFRRMYVYGSKKADRLPHRGCQGDSSASAVDGGIALVHQGAISRARARARCSSSGEVRGRSKGSKFTRSRPETPGCIRIRRAFGVFHAHAFACCRRRICLPRVRARRDPTSTVPALTGGLVAHQQ